VTAPAITGPALRRCAQLSEMDDVGLGARFLAGQPAHAQRAPEVVRRWAEVAMAAGRHAALGAGLGAALGAGVGAAQDTTVDATSDATEAGLTVVSARAGIRPGWVVVAEYVERRREVRVHTDVLDLAERLVERLDWGEWYPPDALRSAAVAHELGHRRLHGAAARELRAALGLRVLRLGRYQRYGHVSGAAELFSHGYAQARCGLGRSPLLLTFALATVVGAGAGTGKDAA
jgi:hypothetical protein